MKLSLISVVTVLLTAMSSQSFAISEKVNVANNLAQGIKTELNRFYQINAEGRNSAKQVNGVSIPVASLPDIKLAAAAKKDKSKATKSASGLPTGKRQHKPVSTTKSSRNRPGGKGSLRAFNPQPEPPATKRTPKSR